MSALGVRLARCQMRANTLRAALILDPALAREATDLAVELSRMAAEVKRLEAELTPLPPAPARVGMGRDVRD